MRDHNDEIEVTDEMITVKLTADATELSFLLDKFKAPLQVIDRFVDLADLPDELVSFKVDDSAASAGELIVRLYPSDAFLSFAAAILAGNCDSLIVEDSHIST